MTDPSHPRPSPRGRSRALPAALLAVAVLAACSDLPLQPERAAVPDGPSMLLNPLCAGSGGTTHAAAVITTAEQWYASGNPHRVTGSQDIGTGGSLRLRPGVLVCFSPGTFLFAWGGGHLSVDGADTALVVLTAADPAQGWGGIELFDPPAATSFIDHARIELVHVDYPAVYATTNHTVVLDSVHIRQSGRAVQLFSPQSRILYSRIDTTTSRLAPAVFLGDSTRFTQTTVRGAAGVGVWVIGESGVQLLGGRIEGSGDTGLRVFYENSVSAFQPIRVTGGSGHGVEMPIGVLAKGYGTAAEMDSLAGNARDTVIVTGGTLASPVYPTAVLPWRLSYIIDVVGGGSLRPQPGAHLLFEPYSLLEVRGGGRLLSRGTQAAPVLLTADDPAHGWLGIQLQNTPSSASFVTNTRIEHVSVNYVALQTDASHAVVIDSTVFRRVGIAAVLESTGSRMSRTRVDTTLNAYGPAVTLGANARLESTLIRSASGDGLLVATTTAQVLSCEVRESVGNGIVSYMWGAEVHNCNVVDNGGAGVTSPLSYPFDAEGNWWGDAAGPTGTNGDGAGATVDYTPWLTAPVTLPYVP